MQQHGSHKTETEREHGKEGGMQAAKEGWRIYYGRKHNLRKIFKSSTITVEKL